MEDECDQNETICPVAAENSHGRENSVWYPSKLTRDSRNPKYYKSDTSKP